VHATVKALFDAAGQPGDDRSLENALFDFFEQRVTRFTSQLHVELFDEFVELQVKNRTENRLTVLGFIYLFGGQDLFWLDLVRDPSPGITARWALYCEPDERTRAGKLAAANVWSIEHPEALDWRVVIVNAETAEDADAK
jgi:hypothetical protein